MLECLLRHFAIEILIARENLFSWFVVDFSIKLKHLGDCDDATTTATTYSKVAYLVATEAQQQQDTYRYCSEPWCQWRNGAAYSCRQKNIEMVDT